MHQTFVNIFKITVNERNTIDDIKNQVLEKEIPKIKIIQG